MNICDKHHVKFVKQYGCYKCNQESYDESIDRQ